MAAWELIKAQPADRGLELATINPSLVVGPMIRRAPCGSMEVIQKLMERAYPAVPDLNFWVVNIFDVAYSHVLAMVVPEAAGKRFMVSSREMGMREMARLLAAEFNPRGYSVPTSHLSDWVLRLASCFDPAVVGIIPQLGLHEIHDHSQAEKILGIKFHPVEPALLQLAASGVQAHMIKGPSSGGHLEDYPVDLPDVPVEPIAPSKARALLGK
jgi:dihydroflavonol-4-reductase